MPPGASAQHSPCQGSRMGRADSHLCADEGRCPGALRQGWIPLGTPWPSLHGAVSQSLISRALCVLLLSLPYKNPWLRRKSISFSVWHEAAFGGDWCLRGQKLQQIPETSNEPLAEADERI